MKKRAIMLTESGVTLTELIVAMAIVAILAVALGFSYQGWMGRYKMEKQIKGIYTDLMDARAKAMGRDSMYFVDFPAATQYRISIDDSDGVDKDNGGNGTFQPQIDPAVPTDTTDTTQPTFPKTLEYAMAGGVQIAFDSRGLIYTGNPPNLIGAAVTIRLAAAGQPGYEPPDYDCISLLSSRIKMGIMTGGACDVK